MQENKGYFSDKMKKTVFEIVKRNGDALKEYYQNGSFAMELSVDGNVKQFSMYHIDDLTKEKALNVYGGHTEEELLDSGRDVLGDGTYYPAGVQYFPARAPVVASDGALTDEEAEALRIREWKRKGLLLLDEAVLLAMQPEGSPKRLDFVVKKDGTASGGVANREDFAVLEKYMMLLLRQIVDDISSGNVTANPYTRGNTHNACAYCPYGEVCHSELVEGRRDYAAMKADEFWDRIRKKVADNG